MANEQAWKDIKMLERSLRGMQGHIAELRNSFRQYEEVRRVVQSNSQRRTQLAELLAVHPSLTVQQIDTEYSKYRELIDWLYDKKI